jgi:hypothetical protein
MSISTPLGIWIALKPVVGVVKYFDSTKAHFFLHAVIFTLRVAHVKYTPTWQFVRQEQEPARKRKNKEGVRGEGGEEA